MKKRIHIIMGHFGSGKTEFAINYAVKLKEKFAKVALIDLDIINMYFRSREREDELRELGIEVYSSSISKANNLDVPALDPSIFKPLQNEEYQVVIDLGGDAKGAFILRRISHQIKDSWNIFVINFYRDKTRDVESALVYLREIEAHAGVKVNSLCNTTHMLKSTSSEDVRRGYALAKEFSQKSGISLDYTVCLEELVEEVNDIPGLFPIHLYLRSDWMS